MWCGEKTLSLQGVVLAGILVAFLMYQSAHAGDMYRWTDANGEIHLSETPPSGLVQPKASRVSKDARKDYLEFMSVYDQKWKSAPAAEREALDRERKRLAREASAALQGNSQYRTKGILPESHPGYESLGAHELWQARWAMIQAQRDVRNVETQEELDRKTAEMKQKEAAYDQVLSHTSKDDQNQANRIEQRERYRKSP
jgi:hypothetical protein